MGGLVSDIFGDETETTTNSNGGWSSGAWTPAMSGMYDQMINDVINGGVPQGPGHVGLNDSQLGALTGIGSEGSAGQYYAGILSGEGRDKREAALQSQITAAGDLAADALGGELSAIGLGMGGHGMGNSSRRGIMEGVASGNAQAQLAASNANLMSQFQQNEQGLMSNAANNLQGIYKDQFTAGSVIQDDEKQKQLAAWKEKYGQTSAGMMEFLAGMGSNVSGIAGGNQWGTSDADTDKHGMFGQFWN